MKVVIPLAGYGTRLRPHTYTKPKPLINVAGKPVLGHLLDKLSELDISQYIFVVGYLGDQIAQYINAHYDIPACYVEQHEMLGQSHAIYLAKDHLNTDEPVFIVFGDHIFETDFALIKNPKSDAVIYVKEVEDPRRYGVVMMNEQGHIIKFVEKPENPPSRLAVIGLYYINSGKKLVEALEWQINVANRITKNEYYIADALQYLVDNGMIFLPETVSNWLDCGNPDAVLAANQYLLSDGGMDNSDALDIKDAIIVPPVRIHPTAVISQSVIGPNVTISANCQVTGSIIRDSIVGENAVIADVLLTHSLIGQNASVNGHYNTVNVGDSSSVGMT